MKCEGISVGLGMYIEDNGKRLNFYTSALEGGFVPYEKPRHLGRARCHGETSRGSLPPDACPIPHLEARIDPAEFRRRGPALAGTGGRHVGFRDMRYVERRPGGFQGCCLPRQRITMTAKQRVYTALSQEQPEFCPWHFEFTVPAHQKMVELHRRRRFRKQTETTSTTSAPSGRMCGWRSRPISGATSSAWSGVRRLIGNCNSMPSLPRAALGDYVSTRPGRPRSLGARRQGN